MNVLAWPPAQRVLRMAGETRIVHLPGLKLKYLMQEERALVQNQLGQLGFMMIHGNLWVFL